jgi:hypothetical protein
MSPNRNRSSRNSIEQKGHILLAIQAIQKYEIPSVRETARRFNIPESTLRDRLHGRVNRAEARANGHKLTEIEEKTLLQWVLSMDTRGSAPRPSMVYGGFLQGEYIFRTWVTLYIMIVWPNAPENSDRRTLAI